MNLVQLRTAIASYTENTFSTADLDTFIQQAEQRIYNSVQLPSSRQATTLVTTVGVDFVTPPIGVLDSGASTFSGQYLAPYSLAVVVPPTQVRQFLLFKDPTFIRSAFPNAAPGTGQGIPTHYAQIGANLLLGPTPDAVYTLELVYFGYPSSIVAGGGDPTYLGNNFDSALLYGALVEAYIFMKGEQDIMAAYDAKFKESLALLKQLVDAKLRQDTYRSAQVRYPVT